MIDKSGKKMGTNHMNRRGFLTAMGTLAATSALPYPTSPGSAASGPHLGLVTYLWGKDMDLETLIDHCEKSGMGAVELRTTHAHGVEPSLNRQQRKAVKEHFANSPVKLLSLGTAEEYNHPEPVRLLQAMEDSRAFIDLARDVGAIGVKVRPNRLYPDIPHEKTIDQIARCLNELGAYAEGEGQEIYVEVHGEGTSRLPVIQAIFDRIEANNVGVCWNCNAEDLLAGGLEANFNLVVNRLGRTVHVRELDDAAYPYARLFRLLNSISYPGWVLLECRTDPADKLKALQRQQELFTELLQKA
jgi:hypothetical protein